MKFPPPIPRDPPKKPFDDLCKNMEPDERDVFDRLVYLSRNIEYFTNREAEIMVNKSPLMLRVLGIMKDAKILCRIRGRWHAVDYTPKAEPPPKEPVKNYNEYLKSDHWLETRREALQCYGDKCVVCDSRKNLNVHHKNYDTLWCENMIDLVVLCDNCHKKFHGK